MHKNLYREGGGCHFGKMAKWHYGELARNEWGIDSDQSSGTRKYSENRQLLRNIHQNTGKLLQNTHRTPCLELNTHAAFRTPLATIRSIRQ